MTNPGGGGSVSFSFVITCISLLFAAVVFLATLLVNVRDGDAARTQLLSSTVSSTAALATAQLELVINSTIARQQSSSRAVRLLGTRVFHHSSPWVQDPSNSSHWTMSPLVERAYTNVFNKINEGFWATKPANTEVLVDAYRWRDGTAGLMIMQNKQQRGGMTIYRSDLNNGFWLDGMGGFDKPLSEFSTNFVWNLTTLETIHGEAAGVYSARTTFVNGPFWMFALMLAGRIPKPQKNWRFPHFSEVSFLGAGGSIFYVFPMISYDKDGSPLLINARVLDLSQFSVRLSDSLVQKKVGFESSTNTSFGFLVDRRHSLVVSMASRYRGASVYERREFIPGKTTPDKNCIPYPATKAVACIKNISTAPEFSLLKALLLAGNSSLEGDALDDGLKSSSNPMLSHPDMGGDLALNIITSSDDGVEYYAAVQTLALPTEQDLKFSLITFTPHDLFAAEAMRARNTAIGVAVAVALVVVVILQLLLMGISSAVSELSQQMSDPLALLAASSPSSTGEDEPSPGRSGTAGTVPRSTVGAKVLYALAIVGEIRVVRDNFEFCVERIRQLRGFLGKASIDFVTGKQIAPPVASMSSDGDTLGPSPTFSGGDVPAAAAALAATAAATAGNAPRRVRFHDQLISSLTEINAPSSAAEEEEEHRAATEAATAQDDDSDDVNGTEPSSPLSYAAGTNGTVEAANGDEIRDDANQQQQQQQQQKVRAMYPLELRRQSKSDRFACVSISFPFVGKALAKLALEKINRDESSLSKAQQHHFESQINEIMFDIVAATAEAANSILCNAHATSIQDLSVVGDEAMCCCRLNSRKGAKRSMLLVGILNECVEAAFALRGKFTKPHQKRGEAAAAAAPAAVDAAGATKKSKCWMSRKTVFVAAGVSGGHVMPLNHHHHHHQYQHPSDQDSNTSSSRVKEETMLRPFSVVGPAVSDAHAIQKRTMSKADSMIFDSDMCNILVRDSPRARVRGENNNLPQKGTETDQDDQQKQQKTPEQQQDQEQQKGEGDDPPMDAMLSDESFRWRPTHRVAFHVPFAIGIDSDLYRVVEPNYISVESCFRPAAKQSAVPELYSIEQRAGTRRDHYYAVLRLAPVKITRKLAHTANK